MVILNAIRRFPRCKLLALHFRNEAAESVYQKILLLLRQILNNKI